MQTGGLNEGSALKTLPVFSSTATTTLPLDIGIHMMDERPNDVSSLVAKLPSHAVTTVTTAVLNSAVNGSNTNGQSDVDRHRLYRNDADHYGHYHSGMHHHDEGVHISNGSAQSDFVQVHGEGFGQVHGEGFRQVHGEGFGQVHGEGFGQVHGEGFGQVHGEGFGQVHGEGQYISTVLVEDLSEHVHESGCKCDLCYMNLNEVTNASDVVFHDSETYHSRTLNQHFVKDIGTKVRIFQRTPRVKHVPEIIYVPELCFEERPIVLTKNRVVMVDVEESEMVPIIKEVKKMKKITVHKIHEERRNQTFSEPHIEYVRRGTMIRIPRICKVEEHVEVKVPVVRKVQEKVRVAVPTGEWIENPIKERNNINGNKVEAVLARSRYVEFVMLRVDSIRGQTVALIAANQAALERWAKDSGVGYSNFADLCTKQEARNEVLASLLQVAKEGALEISEIPTEVRLYRGDVLNAFMTVAQTTIFNSHSNRPGTYEEIRGLKEIHHAKLGKVEAVLVRSAYVDFVILCLDSIKDHSVALIAANQGALERWAKDSGVGYSDFADLCSKPEARKEVLASLVQVAREGALESFETPTKVRLYRGDVLHSFLTVAQTTKLNPHSNTAPTYSEIRDVEKLVKYRTREGGEYAKLGKVEAVLVRSRYVDFVRLRLDSSRGHSVALVAANQAALERWAKDSGVGYSDFAELCSKPEARKEVLASLVQVAREGGLASVEIPAKVRLYLGDLLNAFLAVTQTTQFYSHSHSHSESPATHVETRDVKGLADFGSGGDVKAGKLGKVEAVLVRSRYVDFVMLRVDSIRGQTVALIAANQAALERWAKDSGVGYSNFADLCTKQEARNEVLASLLQVAKEGALEISEIPTEVRLYRGDVLNAFMTVAQTTIFNSHSNRPGTYEEIRGLKEIHHAKLGKVEAVLVRSAYVDFVILCLDSIKDHSVALIAANQGALERWAKDSGVGYSDFADLCSKPEARKEVLASLVQVAREGALESFETPTKVRLYRGDVLHSFLTVAQTTKLNPHSNTAPTYSEIRDVEKLVKYRTREGGEYAKLGKVEAVLVRSRYVDFVRLRLDSSRGHSVALVAANQAALERWAKDSGVGYSDFAELCSKPEARKEVLASLVQVAREGGLASVEIPAKVRLYLGDLLNAFLAVTQTTQFYSHSHSHSESPATHVETRDVKGLADFGSGGDVKAGKLGKVEAVLVRSRYVDFVMLRVDSIRGQTVALIAANQAALERWAKDSGVGYSNFADLCTKKEARKEVLASLLQVAKEGALEISEIPTKVRLYRGDVLNAFMMVAQTTIFNSHSNRPGTYEEIRGLKEIHHAKLGKVEAVLVRSAYVDFVILCLDSIKDHSVALIAANQGALERWAKDSGVGYSDFADLCSKPEARKEVLASLVQVAREGALESFETPTKVRLYRGDVLHSFLTVAQTTKLNPHSNTAPTYSEIRDVEKLVKYRTREGGEYAKLGKVEAVLVRSRYVDFVRLRLDSSRGHSVALVAANQAALERWAKDSGVGYSDFAELCSKPEARKEVLASLVQVAREGGLASVEIPAKVRLYLGDLLNAFLAVTQTTKFSSLSNTAAADRDGRNVREVVGYQSQDDVDYAKLGKVEAVLVGSPYVDFVMLRVDSIRGQTVALIAANQPALERWARDCGVGFSDFADLCLKPEARKEVLASLIQVASQGKLEGFKIPSEVALLADREDMVTAAVMLTHMSRGVGSTAPSNERTSSVQITNGELYLGKDPVQINSGDVHKGSVDVELKGPVRTTNEDVYLGKGGVQITSGDMRKGPVRTINEEVDLGKGSDMVTPVQTINEELSRGKGAEIVTAQDGENGMLRKVEAVLKRSPYVDYVLIHPDPVYGHYVAQVVADHAVLERWAKDSGVGFSDFADLCSKPEARKEVLNSVIQVAREGGLERFEIPTEVALVAEHGDLVTVALTGTQMTTLKHRADDFYSRFLNLTVQEKGSRDVDVLDKVFHAVNMQADKYTSLGKVEAVIVRSPYVDYVMLHLDPIHGHCVALVVANQTALEDWAKSDNVDYSDFADLCSKAETRKNVLASVLQMAREGELERFEIPKKIALLADRGDLLNVAAMLTHMTRLKQREGDLNMRFLELRVHDNESCDVEMLDKVLDAVNMQAGEYGRLGKVETVLVRSPYVDNVVLHLDPIHGRCVALILANPAALKDWAKSASVDYSDFADLCSKPEARKVVFASVIQVAREGELERFEIPMEVVLLAAGDDLVTAAITRREGPVMTEGEVDLWDEEWGMGSVLAGWAHQQIVVHD